MKDKKIISTTTDHALFNGRLGRVPFCGLAALGAVATIWSYPLGHIRLSFSSAEVPIPALFMLVAVISAIALKLNDVVISISSKTWRPMMFLIFLLGGAYLVANLWAEGVDGLRIVTASWIFLSYIFMAPFLVTALGFVDIKTVKNVFFLAVSVAVLIGYYRFFSGTGGLPSEHLLGYWGIRYEPSTRNADVLYPIVMNVIAFNGVLNSKHKYLVAFWLIIFVVAGIAVLLSFSRGGWVAVLFSWLYLAYKNGTKSKRQFYKRIFKPVAIIMVACIIFGFLAPNKYENRLVARLSSITKLKDSSDNSNLARIDILEASAIAILTHPIGSGSGLFGSEVQVPSLNRAKIGNAENAWVTSGVEAGWVGFGSLVLLAVYLWKANRKNELVFEQTHYIYSGLTLAVLIYLLFNNEVNNLFFWMLLIFLVRATAYHRGCEDNEVRGTPAIL